MTSCLADLGGCTALWVDVLSIQTLQMTEFPNGFHLETTRLVGLLDTLPLPSPVCPSDCKLRVLYVSDCMPSLGCSTLESSASFLRQGDKLDLFILRTLLYSISSTT